MNLSTTSRIVIAFGLMALAGITSAQQINIPRIELMPKQPAPYQMRDWKQVARGYDSLVFDFSATGTYLPLVWINSNTVNYPAQTSFGLHTVVGTTLPNSAEAINCIPAIIGATLSGIDKSDQNSRNWPLMAQEWFNKRPEQNVYKNHPVDNSGDDWWYETMPNVFFFQMNALYPGTGNFDSQFATIADRWLQSVEAMGGSAAPWHVPFMDHRGWLLESMTPYDNSVHEPEAAGAIGWMLYNAWIKTGNSRYRTGAEWSMEFLNGWQSNPAYELQLPYGVYTAARMNAELGTTYDVPKMVNWCFDVGPLRSWGAIVGNWGGYDCSGLIGEVNGNNDYAFAMNTFEQAGALVPLVRYDTRFARAIGKWMLNAANAARLFYPTGLSASNQDSYAWSAQYDPNGYIAHEAMRQLQQGHSPFATGDAISGGWGNTNLALYGSSHVGIYGGIIETTDVPMILKLDLLKTDYYHGPAYPSSLVYNPYDSTRTIVFDAGARIHDLYDAAIHTVFASSISGKTPVEIPANRARVIVVIPAGGNVTYSLDHMLVNGIVADYHAGNTLSDIPPRIKALSFGNRTILRGDTVNIYCTATDRDGDSLHFLWHATSGTILGSDSIVRWVAPQVLGDVPIDVTITDGKGGSDTASIIAPVVSVMNISPVIRKITATPRKLNPATQIHVSVDAYDGNGDTVSFQWSAASGILTGDGSVVQWTAPSATGNYFIICTVRDGHGGTAIDSVGVEVRDLSAQQTGNFLAYFPFDGSAVDASGNGHNATASAVTSVSDHTGHLGKAYSFNGTTSYVQVPNAVSLNVQQAVSVNFWMYVNGFYSREQYPISHGNWQNRWKVSISNGKLRWTVKTASGTKDLDSETPLALNTNYNVTVTYNGSDMEIYLNGVLDAFTHQSGLISTTNYDITIGQVLPGDQNYNFNGVLDEVRLYDYALSLNEIATLAEIPLSVPLSPANAPQPLGFSLYQNYPNPFNPSTEIRYVTSSLSTVTLKIFNLLGQEMASLVHATQPPGEYRVRWDASDVPGGVYFAQLRSGSFEQISKLILLR